MVVLSARWDNSRLLSNPHWATWANSRCLSYFITASTGSYPLPTIILSKIHSLAHSPIHPHTHLQTPIPTPTPTTKIRFSIISILALALSASATPLFARQVTGDYTVEQRVQTCGNAQLNCCNKIEKKGDTTNAGLLGAVFGSGDICIQCSPINIPVVGVQVPINKACDSKAACCQGEVSQNGLINLGCLAPASLI
ncbi:hypothetical protein HOY80DRAFT_1023661 [Tuber brumale]|nr:hypothetical protein HOY80DRAFT_1023661 [Tuber brumale]